MKLELVLVCWLCLWKAESVKKENCRDRIRLISGDQEDQFKLTDVPLHDTVILDCHYCNEKDDSAPKIWYREDPLGRGPVTEVQLDMQADLELNRVHVTPHHALVIHNVTLADAALYFCHGAHGEDASFRYNYLVDVVNSSMLPILGNLSSWPLYHDSAVLKLQRENISIITEWMIWGPCNSCNRQQGEKRRTGKCRVKQPEVPELSCSSILLAEMFPEISSVTRTIPDFVQIERCTGVCSVDMKHVSMKISAHKSRVIKKVGSRLTLACIGTTLEDVVTWVKDNKMISAVQPRISVDLFNTLLIETLEETDSGTYSCFVDDILLHEFVVVVLSRSELHGMGLFRNMVFLLFVMLLCFVCYCGGLVVAWTRRHRFMGYNNLA